MKPNGMRAWRKWGKRNGAGRGAMASFRVFRRHRETTFADVEGLRPAPLHAREFLARSLCGMSMGARKRAARICPGCIECRNAIPEIDFGLRCDSSGVFAQSPEQWRRRYKIGQRLRPCPGCPDCVPQMQRWAVDGAWVEDRAVRHRDGCSHDDPSGYCCFGEIVTTVGECSGSGVLPARKAGR